ncbi:MAG TPA: serine/threonine protein kinase, partial [Myxococcus sp.]|nr:serine/threonine protein kinase [Myxococcus sp.]
QLLRPQELDAAAEVFDAPRPRSGGKLKWALAALAAVATAAGTGLYFTQAQWAPLVQQFTR